MATKLRGHKNRQIAVRFSPRQVGKLEKLAVIRDGTISDVIRELVDNFGVAYPLPSTFQNRQGNSVLRTGTDHESQPQQHVAA